MPQKKIIIPPPIRFTNTVTGEPIALPDGELTFEAFVGKLNENPLWAESYQAALAQRSIRQALATRHPDVQIVISEEDWKFLESAAKTPRTLIPGMGVIAGLGYTPGFASQLVVFQAAIINAETI